MKLRHAMTAVAALFLTAAFSFSSYAGAWKTGSDGSWSYEEGGQKLTGWHWIDGNGDGTAECYYFDASGRMSAETMVGSWLVNGDGAWVWHGDVQTRSVPPGAHYPYGAENGTGASGTASGNANTAASGGTSSAPEYTPARARAESVLPSASFGKPYMGKVWSLDDYYVTKAFAKPGQISRDYRCHELGCYNPNIGFGSFCQYHTCKEPGCKQPISIFPFNAGFCYDHMKEHGIDSYEFTKMEEAEKKAARAAQSTTSSGKSGSSGRSGSTGSSGSSGNGSGSGRSSYYYDDEEEEESSGSSSSGRSSSDDWMHSYDEGYEDVWENDDYDHDRYNRDWEYMLGVDDALDEMDEYGEEW